MTGSGNVNSRKFLDSLRYAIEGLEYCVKTQRNMRIHLAIAAITAIFCVVLRITRVELVIIIISTSMVFICEVINTAVEKAVDTATQEYHPIAKISKDVAAGAVLVAVLNSVLVGFLVFGNYIWIIVLNTLK